MFLKPPSFYLKTRISIYAIPLFNRNTHIVRHDSSPYWLVIFPEMMELGIPMTGMSITTRIVVAEDLI